LYSRSKIKCDTIWTIISRNRTIYVRLIRVSDGFVKKSSYFDFAHSILIFICYYIQRSGYFIYFSNKKENNKIPNKVFELVICIVLSGYLTTPLHFYNVEWEDGINYELKRILKEILYRGLVAPCSLGGGCQCFGETYCLQLQSRSLFLRYVGIHLSDHILSKPMRP
jgi:hypothetical protein